MKTKDFLSYTEDKTCIYYSCKHNEIEEDSIRHAVIIDAKSNPYMVSRQYYEANSGINKEFFALNIQHVKTFRDLPDNTYQIKPKDPTGRDGLEYFIKVFDKETDANKFIEYLKL